MITSTTPEPKKAFRRYIKDQLVSCQPLKLGEDRVLAVHHEVNPLYANKTIQTMASH